MVVEGDVQRGALLPSMIRECLLQLSLRATAGPRGHDLGVLSHFDMFGFVPIQTLSSCVSLVWSQTVSVVLPPLRHCSIAGTFQNCWMRGESATGVTCSVQPSAC